MLTRIYHKKDEQFNIEFFQDKECRQAFNFENVKNLYIELEQGDCTPIFKLSNKLWSLSIRAKIFTPTWYLGFYDGISPETPLITLNDVENINFSKYIPTDNAILFLSEDNKKQYQNCFCDQHIGLYIDDGKNDKKFIANNIKSLINGIADVEKGNITIFIESYTESEIKKTIDIAKELKEKYGIEEVNVFALHCFANLYGGDDYINAFIDKGVHLFFKEFINKIIITNSTCGCKTQNTKRLQFIDCYDIFNNWIKKL